MCISGAKNLWGCLRILPFTEGYMQEDTVWWEEMQARVHSGWGDYSWGVIQFGGGKYVGEDTAWTVIEAEWDAGGRLNTNAETGHLRHGYSEPECYDRGMPRCNEEGHSAQPRPPGQFP